MSSQLLGRGIFLIISSCGGKDTAIGGKLILSCSECVYLSFLIVLLSFSVGIHPRNVGAEVVNAFLLVSCKFLSGLLSPTGREEILLSIEVSGACFLVRRLITVVIDVCVSMVRSYFVGSLLVVVLCSMKLFSLSVKWLMGLAVESVVFGCGRDVCLMRHGLMMFHGRVRVGESHASGVTRELVVLN